MDKDKVVSETDCLASITERKTTEGEFVKPELTNLSKSVDKFKKPVLIGPRKGFKKNSLAGDNGQLINESLKTLPAINKSTEDEVLEDKEQSLKPIVPKEIPSFPLVLSDFSDKILPSEFPYSEPPWKGVPEDRYFLEELKSGVIEKEIDLCGRSFTVLGRLDHCHVVMAHQTVSRYHAILQYRATRQGIYDKGFYLYDMGSTHGTFLNKNRIKPQTYIRIQVGHVIKFGCSTRLFILQGPTDDEEPESEHSVTELKEMRQQELAEREKKKEEERLLKEQEELKMKEELQSRGVDWGMGEDADEETDLSENPYAVTTNEEIYAEDPKKELKKWFEREGDELNFETEQAERGKMVCRITLPLDNGKGGEVVIESTGKSKKEATSSCALEACRYIDRLGLFRQTHQETKKRQVRNWEENDYYDSDEDTYFDRTGDIDEKREKRMKKAGKVQNTVETYESLMLKHEALVKKISEFERKYAEMTQVALSSSKTSANSDNEDELDQYMYSLKQNAPNKLEIRMCQVELKNLKEEESRLVNLINLARPASLPELKPYIPKKNSKRTEPVKESISEQNFSLPTSDSVVKMEVCHDQLSEDVGSSDSQNTDKAISKPVIGPRLHPPIDSTSSEVAKKPKRSRVRQRDRNTKVMDIQQFDSGDYSDVTWQPPVGQTGDGRTSLNDKFGY